MTADEALATSRAVLFEHADEDTFRYFSGGSGLFFTWLGSGYLMTATHVTRGRRDDQVRAPLDDVSRAFLRFDRAFSPIGDDHDWKDLTFFRVDRGIEKSSWLPYGLPLDMALLRMARAQYVSGLQLLVSGYPSSHRWIDYEAGHIALTRCILHASYDGGAQDARGKHQIRVDADLESFDGLSGSPVFLEATRQSILLAGIVIQGHAASGICHMLGTEVLAGLLSQLPDAAA